MSQLKKTCSQLKKTCSQPQKPRSVRATEAGIERVRQRMAELPRPGNPDRSGWTHDDLADKSDKDISTVKRFLRQVPVDRTSVTSITGALGLLPTEVIEPKKPVYDSECKRDFERWDFYSSVGEHDRRISFYDSDGIATFKIKALSDEYVGVNKFLSPLHGKVEFQYKVVYSKATKQDEQNIYFCMIPMKAQRSVERQIMSGLTEFNGKFQDDPNNPYSPYRERFYVPIEHNNSGKWHKGCFSYDFREIRDEQQDSALYSIFAPRINEGCPSPAAAELLVAEIKVWEI